MCAAKATHVVAWCDLDITQSGFFSLALVCTRRPKPMRRVLEGASACQVSPRVAIKHDCFGYSARSETRTCDFQFSRAASSSRTEPTTAVGLTSLGRHPSTTPAIKAKQHQRTCATPLLGRRSEIAAGGPRSKTVPIWTVCPFLLSRSLTRHIPGALNARGRVKREGEHGVLARYTCIHQCKPNATVLP